MRVITLNVNGIRSAAAKGLFPWLAKQKADVICLQEVRATEEQLAGHDVALPGYHAHYLPPSVPVTPVSPCTHASGRNVWCIASASLSLTRRGATSRRSLQSLVGVLAGPVPSRFFPRTCTPGLEKWLPLRNYLYPLRVLRRGRRPYILYSALGIWPTVQLIGGTGAPTNATRASCRTSAPGSKHFARPGGFPRRLSPGWRSGSGSLQPGRCNRGQASAKNVAGASITRSQPPVYEAVRAPRKMCTASRYCG